MGINSIKLLDANEVEAIPKEEIIRICNELREQIKLVN
jgi:hypothetical protein